MPQQIRNHNGKEYSVIIVKEPRKQDIYSHERTYSARVLLVSLIEMDHAAKRVFDIPFIIGFIPSLGSHKMQLVFCTRGGLFMREPIQVPTGLTEDNSFLQGYAEKQLFNLLENHDFNMQRLYENVKFSEMVQKELQGAHRTKLL